MDQIIARSFILVLGHPEVVAEPTPRVHGCHFGLEYGWVRLYLADLTYATTPFEHYPLHKYTPRDSLNEFRRPIAATGCQSKGEVRTLDVTNLGLQHMAVIKFVINSTPGV
jgi:hypothetical protein